MEQNVYPPNTVQGEVFQRISDWAEKSGRSDITTEELKTLTEDLVEYIGRLTDDT